MRVSVSVGRAYNCDRACGRDSACTKKIALIYLHEKFSDVANVCVGVR